MAQATADVVGVQLEAVRKKKLEPLYMWEDVFVNQIKKSEAIEKVSSREVRVPLQIRPGSRYGYLNTAGGRTGRGTATKYDKATLSPIADRIAVEINQDVIDQTGGEPQAILNILATEVANAMKEMRVQKNASLQTAGDGILATLSGVPSGNVFAVASAPFYSQLLREGQIVSVYNSGLTTKRGECEILQIDHPNANVTMDSTPAGSTTGDVLLPEGLSGASPAWFFGIPYHVSNAATGTWLGFQRSAEPNIRASGVNGGGNALTTPVIRLALTKLIQRLGQTRINAKSLKAHLHPTQANAYEELGQLISEIQKGGANEKLDLFLGEQRMAGVPTEPDVHAARNRIDFLNMTSFGRAVSKEVDFLKLPDGRYYTRPTDASDGSPIASVLFHIYGMEQIFCSNPLANSYVYSLAIPSGYDTL